MPFLFIKGNYWYFMPTTQWLDTGTPRLIQLECKKVHVTCMHMYMYMLDSVLLSLAPGPYDSRLILLECKSYMQFYSIHVCT